MNTHLEFVKTNHHIEKNCNTIKIEIEKKKIYIYINQ